MEPTVTVTDAMPAIRNIPSFAQHCEDTLRAPADKRWLTLKNQGNAYFAEHKYEAAIAVYRDAFFIAGGWRASVPLLSATLQRLLPETSALHRVSNTAVLMRLIGSFVSHDFTVPVDRSCQLLRAGELDRLNERSQCLPPKIRSLHKNFRHLVNAGDGEPSWSMLPAMKRAIDSGSSPIEPYPEGKYSNRAQLPNMGGGIVASNIAQCLLNIHQREHHLEVANEALGVEKCDAGVESILLVRTLQWLRLSHMLYPQYVKTKERELVCLSRLPDDNGNTGAIEDLKGLVHRLKKKSQCKVRNAIPADVLNASLSTWIPLGDLPNYSYYYLNATLQILKYQRTDSLRVCISQIPLDCSSQAMVVGISTFNMSGDSASHDYNFVHVIPVDQSESTCGSELAVVNTFGLLPAFFETLINTAGKTHHILSVMVGVGLFGRGEQMRTFLTEHNVVVKAGSEEYSDIFPAVLENTDPVTFVGTHDAFGPLLVIPPPPALPHALGRFLFAPWTFDARVLKRVEERLKIAAQTGTKLKRFHNNRQLVSDINDIITE